MISNICRLIVLLIIVNDISPIYYKPKLEQFKLFYLCRQFKIAVLVMRFIYLVFLVEMLFLDVALFGQEGSDWKLVKNCDNNIKAYVKKVPGSQIKSVKVETVLEATLSELVTLIKDSEYHHNWVFLNEKASTIEETDDFNWKYYGYIGTPWPVSDRDFVTDASLTQNAVDCLVTITSVGIPEFLPEKECCVRIPYILSVWTFNPIGNGSVHASLEIEADLGGNIPLWLVNMAVTRGPVNTMNGLIKELEMGKFSNSNLEYIKELK